MDASDAGEAAHLRETEKIGNDRFSAPVLVGATGMQSVTTATGFRVDQRRTEIVTAEEPFEGAHGMSFPTWIAIRSPRGKTGRDARGCLQRLLIERAWLSA